MTSSQAARVPSLAEEVGGGIALPGFEKNIGAMVREQASRDPGRVAVRSRAASGKWADLTWGELDRRRRAIAAGLASLGVSRGEIVAVVAPNSVEMLLAELALLTLGAVSAPIFPDYGLEILHHCVTDCGARVVLCGSAVQQHRVGTLKQLERLVVLDGQPLPDDPRALPLSAVEALATPQLVEQLVAAEVVTGPDDLAFVLYTSGTTGRPKGVLLTHGNVLSQQAAISAVWEVGDGDVFLSYLPWHHCFGALFERFMALSRRALLVLDDSRGRDLPRLLANLREVKPTVYFSVPRVYQGLIDRALAEPAARAALLHPKLRFVFTAAAPLEESAYRFFEAAGIPVHEGWGLTETSPSATLTRKDAPRVPLCVGWPLPGTTVKLAPVEASSSDKVGEVLVRGPQVMRGYHRDEEQTARVLLPDGFLRTGDSGEWTEHGLRIRGRVDGVFKLQNGEKVPSAEVEARILSATPLLEQVVALGAGEPHVTALAWISLPAAQRWLESNGLEGGPLTDLVLMPELRRAITEALQSSNQLAPVLYERVRRVLLVPEPLALEQGELTPTQKVVRRAVMARHGDLVQALKKRDPHPLVLELSRPTDPFKNA